MEQVTGIEPASSDWKSEILTIVLYLQNTVERDAFDFDEYGEMQFIIKGGFFTLLYYGILQTQPRSTV